MSIDSTSKGAVYIYKRTGTTWSQEACQASDGAANEFGFAAF